MGNVIRIIYIYFQLVVKSYDIQKLVDHLDCKLPSYFLIVAFNETLLWRYSIYTSCLSFSKLFTYTGKAVRVTIDTHYSR